MRLMSLLLSAFALVASGAHAAPPGPAPAKPGEIVAAWSVIVPSAGAPLTELRIAVQSDGAASDAALCALFEVAATRAGGQPPARHALSPRINPAPDAFPIAVCTAPMQPDWTGAQVQAVAAAGAPARIWTHEGASGVPVALPGPHMIGRRGKTAAGAAALRVVTIADTGCRGKVGAPSDRTYQDCADWSFGAIAQAAAGDAPDLVIHAGDYRYFWEGYPSDPAASPDTWAYWLLDFFAPAQPLLLEAPWAFARGNHETCPWYGTGWSFLLGTGGSYCNGIDAAPWAFHAAPGGDMGNAAHRFVMLDISDDRQAAGLQANFETALTLSAVDSSWWIGHIPAYARLHFRNYVGGPRVQAAMLAATARTGAAPCDPVRSGAPSCRPSAVISGHQHLFQQISFFASGSNSGAHVWPMQVIVGHGGVRLDHAGLNASPCMFDGFDIGGAKTDAVVQARSQHGYVLWTRTAATAAQGIGWTEEARHADGTAMTLTPGGPKTPDCG